MNRNTLSIARRVRKALISRLSRVAYRENRGLQAIEPVLTISFDDIPKSAVTEGARILARHNSVATWFASGTFIDTEPNGNYFTGAELRSLASEGHEIGCHGFGHLDYQDCSLDDAIADLDRNAELFERLGLPKATAFAYPYGRVAPRTKLLCSQRFAVCRGVQPKICGSTADLNLLPSVALYDSCLDRAELNLMLEQLAKDGGLLSMFSHAVTDDPSFFDCSPALLDHTLARASTLGIRVLPISEATALLYPKV